MNFSSFAIRGAGHLFCLPRLRSITLGLALVTMCLMQDGSANAVSLNQRLLRDGAVEVRISGEIVSGDAMRTAEYMDEIVSQGQRVASISLNSEGGVIYEGYLLAKLIRMANVDTVVREKSVCYSACFIPFIAASKKYAFYKARIGVHNASDTKGVSADATLLMVKLTNTLGATDAVLGKMAKTPPDRIAILSPKELEEMGVEVYGRKVVARSSATQCQDPICEIFAGIFGR